MAKTYEALKKAEEEKRRRQEKSGEGTGEPLSEKQEPWSATSGEGPLELGSEGRDPFTPPASPKFWVAEDGPVKLSSQTIEECHRMKYRILESDPKRKIKTILFCSPRPGEGCSTVLIHFAVTLVSGGEKVIMLDANFRAPYLHKPFHLDAQNGVTDLVLGEKQLEEVIKDTPYANLKMVTSGQRYPNPFQLIESPLFYAHLAEMKAQADWVLLDSPPVSSFMDPIALAGRVDRVVMVIRAEKTRWEVALDTKRKLESGNGNILGVVLNDRRYHVPRWLYKRL